MADSYVKLPDDSINLGKKVRTNTRTVGGETVHEHYWIVQDITTDTQSRVLTTTPSASDAGLVVRIVPETQDVNIISVGAVTFETTILGTNELPTLGTASVTTASTAILSTPSGTRVEQFIQNVSDTIIWISDDGNPAVVGQGMALLPYGVYHIKPPQNCPQLGVVGIHAGTGSKSVTTRFVDAV